MAWTRYSEKTDLMMLGDRPPLLETPLHCFVHELTHTLVAPLAEATKAVKPIDRTTLNSWEDIHVTGTIREHLRLNFSTT
jgi:hypothetical protein